MEEKKNYGATLNLPKTDFQMRGNLPENEPKIKEEVLDNDLYEKMLKKNEGKESFVLHDGPPYLSSEKIHVGTALNKILKDIELLDNLSNRNAYTYTDSQVDKMFSYIEKALTDTKKHFKEKKSSGKFEW